MIKTTYEQRLQHLKDNVTAGMFWRRDDEADLNIITSVEYDSESKPESVDMTTYFGDGMIGSNDGFDLAELALHENGKLFTLSEVSMNLTNGQTN